MTLRKNVQRQGAALALRDLRQEFPQYTIWREVTPGRARYHAVRARPGVRPYAVVTASPRELRAALRQPGPSDTITPVIGGGGQELRAALGQPGPSGPAVPLVIQERGHE